MSTDQTDPVFALNPDIDREASRKTFEATGRVRIADLLTPEAAQRLHTCLSKELAWGISYNDGPNARYIPREQVSAMTEDDRNDLLHRIVQRAAKQIQYAYAEAPVMQNYSPDMENKLYVHRALEFLNSDLFLKLISDITVTDSPMVADGMATCFQPGHFLTIHNDADPDGRRIFTYTLDLTTFWRPDWGGTYMFFDEQGQVDEAYNPLFNSLCLFDISQRYSVSLVAPYAQGARFGVTGWYKSPPADA